MSNLILNNVDPYPWLGIGSEHNRKSASGWWHETKGWILLPSITRSSTDLGLLNRKTHAGFIVENPSLFSLTEKELEDALKLLAKRIYDNENRWQEARQQLIENTVESAYDHEFQIIACEKNWLSVYGDGDWAVVRGTRKSVMNKAINEIKTVCEMNDRYPVASPNPLSPFKPFEFNEVNTPNPNGIKFYVASCWHSPFRSGMGMEESNSCNCENNEEVPPTDTSTDTPPKN